MGDIVYDLTRLMEDVGTLRKELEDDSCVVGLDKEIADLSSMLTLHIESAAFYVNASEYMYKGALSSLELEINKALGYIFYDKTYGIRLIMEGKALGIFIEDLSTGSVINVKQGKGAGVRTIISFVLLIFYILYKNSYPVLFLDESYSEISDQYLERFFSYIKSICDGKGLVVIWITHDMRFKNYGDVVYRVNDGVICND
jgi:DNA repair exonuclease SbcCD ATPase subunit